MTWYLVAYVQNPSMRTQRAMLPYFGDDYQPGALPVDSRPFGTHEDAVDALTSLMTIAHWAPDDVVFVQREPRAVVDTDLALKLAMRHGHWQSFLEGALNADPADVRVDAASHPRCLALAASYAPHGLQPGLGFLVDHQTETTFSRTLSSIARYVRDNAVRTWRANEIPR